MKNEENETEIVKNLFTKLAMLTLGMYYSN